MKNDFKQKYPTIFLQLGAIAVKSSGNSFLSEFSWDNLWTKLAWYTDENILEDSYYIVSKTFPGFSTMEVQNCFLFKVKLLVLSNSVLPEQEIWEIFY